MHAIRFRLLSIPGAIAAMSLLVTACGSGAGADIAPPAVVRYAVDRPLTAAELDALPLASIAEGSRLCPGGPGADSLCPRHTANGNWLALDRFAVWELNRVVQVYRDGKATPLAPADQMSRYLAVTAVGPANNNQVLVVDPVSGMAQRYAEDGTHVGADSLPGMTQFSIWLFSGVVPVWQVMQPTTNGPASEVVVRVGRKIGDQDSARTIFRADLPWLRLQDEHVVMAPPFFPNRVVYAFAPDGSVIWSDGSRFTVQKTDVQGEGVWRLNGDFTGPPVDSIDIARKWAEVTSPEMPAAVPDSMADSMAVKTAGTHHPAIGALFLAPDGTILVARASLPQRDSVDYVRLSGAGTPKDRFTLPKASQLMLFGGDSALVFRRAADPAQPGTVVWLRLTGK